VDEGWYAGAVARTMHNGALLLSRSLRAGAHRAVITNFATRGRPTIDADAVGWRC
jgi:hypothetical protein